MRGTRFPGHLHLLCSMEGTQGSSYVSHISAACNQGLLGASGCEGPTLARDGVDIPPELGDLQGDLVTHESSQA